MPATILRPLETDADLLAAMRERDALPAAAGSTGAAVLVANTLCTGGLFHDDER